MASAKPDISNRMDITVSIVTLGNRLQKIVLPAPHSDITYFVSVQEPLQNVAEFFSDRPDVTVQTLNTLGVSRNRNAVLANAKGALLVLGDDDVTFQIDGILKIRDLFAADPNLALVLGWRAERMPPNARSGTRLTRFNSGRTAASELVVRRNALIANGITFDTQFGLGARYGLGEEYVFIADALRSGLKGLNVPIATCSHPHDSTGDNWADPDILFARQAVLRRVFGKISALARSAYAWKHRRKFKSRLQAALFAIGY